MNRILLGLTEIMEHLRMLTSIQKSVLNVAEAAFYLGVSKSYLYKLTSTNRIPHYSPGNKLIFFRKDELDRWATTNGGTLINLKTTING